MVTMSKNDGSGLKINTSEGINNRDHWLLN